MPAETFEERLKKIMDGCNAKMQAARQMQDDALAQLSKGLTALLRKAEATEMHNQSLLTKAEALEKRASELAAKLAQERAVSGSLREVAGVKEVVQREVAEAEARLAAAKAKLEQAPESPKPEE